MRSAVRAATDVAARFGIVTAEPVVLQETNNTVVWLCPEPVVAKVAVRRDAREGVRLEFAVASELEAVGADVARPVPGTEPTTHASTGFVVTLWVRVEGSERAPVPPGELAASLRRLHGALGRTEVGLPSFRAHVAKASRALEEDRLDVALPRADHELLRGSFARGFRALEGARFEARRLHGEPHGGNRIATGQGLRWIDFESACVGPLEWDLAFQPDEVVHLFAEADVELLAHLRRLNSARVATWCLGSRHADMHVHGAWHLALLREDASGEPR